MPTLRKQLLIWVPLIASMSTALAMHILTTVSSRQAHDFLGGKPLPNLTTFYYTPLPMPHHLTGFYYPLTAWPYLFLMPLFIWAIIIAFRKSTDASHATLFAIVTLSISLISLAFCLIAITIPFVSTFSPMSSSH